MKQKVLSHKELLELQSSYVEAAKVNIKNQSRFQKSQQKKPKGLLTSLINWLVN